MLWLVCNKTMYNIIYYIVRMKKQSYNAIIVKKKNCIIVITLLIFTEFEGITIFLLRDCVNSNCNLIIFFVDQC